MDKRYQLELSEKQLRLVNRALEEYFRLALNQWRDLADRLAAKGVDFDSENPKHDEIFNSYIQTRDAVLVVFEAAGRIMWPHTLPQKDEEQLMAEDIWQVIRHQLFLDSGSTDTWRVDAYPAMQWSAEELPTIRRIEEDGV